MPPSQEPVQLDKHGQWHPPFMSRKQQRPITLPSPPTRQAQPVQRQPDEDAIKTQRQAEPPIGANQAIGANSGGLGGANAAGLQPQRTAQPREQFDTFLIGIIIVLVIAILAVLVFIIQHVANGDTPSFSNLGLLPLFLIIYALCVFAGILWGRYQLDTEAKKESERLSGVVNQLEDEIAHLQNESRNLQGHLHKAQSDLAAMRNMPPPVPQPLPQPPVQAGNRVHGRPPANVVISPPQIQQIKPQQSIYDVKKDPPDFNEYEQREHPHEKLYPERGKSGMLRSGWNIVGASRRGYGHAYDGKYREDDFEVRSFPVDTRNLQLDMIMVAIADGVSSKPFSRAGREQRYKAHSASPIPPFIYRN